jgi:hypothetical protein
MSHTLTFLLLTCFALTASTACAAVAAHMWHVANSAPPLVRYCAYVAWVLSGALTVVLAMLAAASGLRGQ